VAELTIPHADERIALEDGRINKTWYDRLQALFTQYRQTNRDLSDTSGGLTTKAAKAQAWSESVIIEFPDDGDYVFPAFFARATTITEVVTECDDGTCTLTVKINSTALGGTANSVSTTRDEQAHTDDNVAADEDDLVLTVSSNSACERMSVTLRGTQVLA